MNNDLEWDDSAYVSLTIEEWNVVFHGLSDLSLRFPGGVGQSEIAEKISSQLKRVEARTVEELDFATATQSDMETEIRRLVKDRDRWKAIAFSEVKIVRDEADLAVKIADSMGSRMADANRYLNESCRWLPDGSLRADIRNHLSQYKPHQP